ncbi:PREDICTED: RING-H2 finger protein ATL66-like [Nicotiana attenuata]|uniref:Ring-h2 finger protein atl34 n=1 Tax=Nicotiana attenuata TaxID=49451 RepID=A0A1J6IHA5_NICAT|nr:PREDICTED: RING-H2 finger protein ATL66-like [Nicotiana attenuata]OIT04066.1 ring-h2 finger protein atl34 [Nicotiana attenuata]
MGFSAAEHPSPLSLIAIFAFIIVYLVISYLVLDQIDQHGDSNDEISAIDSCGSGLSVEQVQEISCYYLKGQANSTCAICLDSLCEAELCRSFPACNHVFHAQCLDPWLAKRPICPTCRTPFRT